MPLLSGKRPDFCPVLLSEMRRLWEEQPEISAAQIAERFDNVTKNTVIGQAHRHGWKPRKASTKEPTTMGERLDALNAKLDALLAETRPFVEGRQKQAVEALAA